MLQFSVYVPVGDCVSCEMAKITFMQLCVNMLPEREICEELGFMLKSPQKRIPNVPKREH